MGFVALNEILYTKICNACDRVLISRSSYFSMANPWLHPIREHPFFLVSYSFFEGGARFKFDFFDVIFRFFRLCFGWFLGLLRAFFFRKFGVCLSLPLKENYDVLIVSHLVSSQQFSSDSDLYFGNLCSELEKNGYRVITAMVDHLPGSQRVLGMAHFPSLKPNHVILTTSMSFCLEFRNFCGVVKESVGLLWKATTEPQIFDRAVTLMGALEVFGSGARAALRLGDQVSYLVSKFRPKVLLTTYEGHPWERLVIKRARMAYPDICCATYQHGNLFRLQHSLRRSLGKEYDPDAIFCSGEVARLDLYSTLRIPDIPIFNLGSHRVSPVQHGYIRHDYSATRSQTCLVIPDGIASEIFRLFDFAINCALISNNVRYIFRLHPANSFQDLVKKNPSWRNLPPNVCLSTASLEEDVGDSAWVLYRGSSAVISAVLGGANPIYLSNFDEMTIDPLYKLNDERLIVSQENQLVGIVSDKNSIVQRETFRDSLEQYCRDVYSAWNPEVFVNFVQLPKGVRR